MSRKSFQEAVEYLLGCNDGESPNTSHEIHAALKIAAGVKNPEKCLCVYHSKDNDGLTCGAIFKNTIPNCRLLGYDYGEPLGQLYALAEGCDRIYFADITIPISDLLKLSQNAYIKIVDHHPSFLKAFEEAGGTSDDENELAFHLSMGDRIEFVYAKHDSACEALWSRQSLPALSPAVQLIGKYDTYRKWDEQMGTSTYSFDDAVAFNLFLNQPAHRSIDGIWRIIQHGKTAVDEGLAIGRTLKSYQEGQDAAHLDRYGFVRKLNGLNVLVQVGGNRDSEAFKSKWDPLLHDLCCTCHFNGNEWTYSLRTMVDSVDVSAIAKSYGGGGHQKAAGFKCNVFIFE